MRDEHDGLALLQEPLDRVDAALLEIGIADGEDLVEEQDIRREICRNRKPQPHVHAGGVVLDRNVDEVFESRIAHDVVIDGFRLRTAQSVNSGIQEHVLAAGQLPMKADAQLDHGRDLRVPGDEQASGGWPMNRGDELQEGALARSVAADQADRFAWAIRSDTFFSAQNSSTDCRCPGLNRPRNRTFSSTDALCRRRNCLETPCASITVVTRAAP